MTLPDQRGRLRSPYGSTSGAVEGMSIHITPNPLVLGTSTYGQNSDLVELEIAGCEVDSDQLLIEFGNAGRVVDFSYDLATWSSFSFFVLPKSLFEAQPKITLWARTAARANAGSVTKPGSTQSRLGPGPSGSGNGLWWTGTARFHHDIHTLMMSADENDTDSSPTASARRHCRERGFDGLPGQVTDHVLTFGSVVKAAEIRRPRRFIRRSIPAMNSAH